MSTSSPSSIQRVLAGISEPTTRSKVEALLKHTVATLENFVGLDDSIYRCYKLDDAGKQFIAELDLALTDLQNRVLGSTQKLLDYLKSSGWLDEEESENFFSSEDDQDIDLGSDFDAIFGGHDAFGETRIARSSPSLPDLDTIDIDEVFDILEEKEEIDFKAALKQLRQELVPLSFTIQDQLNHFKQRLRTAFHQGNYTLAIRELDACRESLAEGLFALISTSFQQFSTEPISLDSLPGFRDVLQRALTVRRGISLLTRQVHPENEKVQNEELPEEVRREALARVNELLERFIESPAFHAMQAPDRWEMVSFSRNIKQPHLRKASQASEGLAKYLESLGMMGRGELVAQHDQETILGINTILGAVRSLLMVSRTGALSMLQDAMNQAKRLYGRNLELDQQLEEWEANPPDLQDDQTAEKVLQRLEQLLR